MESLNIPLSSSPPLKTHSKLTSRTPPLNHLPHFPRISFHKRDTHTPIHLKNHNFISKAASLLKTTTTHSSNSHQNKLSILKSLALLSPLSFPLPSFAIQDTVPSDQVSDKINIEAILISIDDFFNRYPFFVASVTFVWLVVIPLSEEYLKKCKFISANDAYRKLRNEPSSQLLDIRDNKSLMYMGSPNLKILDKKAVWVQFSEGEEEGVFVKKVLEKFGDPANTILCVLDNFDGKSMEVAELLFKSGFKEAYAIKGGLRGKDGWQAIQDTLLPPSMHVFPNKKGKKSKQVEMDEEGITQSTKDNGQVPSSSSVRHSSRVENGSITSTQPTSEANLSLNRTSSPYPNYPDLKPPSSPTPSKPHM